MDLKKIFLKDACPTAMGGQAVMEGIMMKGLSRTSLAVRLPNDDIYIKTMKNKPQAKWAKLPIVRGCIVFFLSLISGMKVLMDSADILEKYEEKYGSGATEEPGRFERWLTDRFGSDAVWNLLIGISVAFSLAVSIGLFVLLPTWVVDLAKHITENAILLNLIEGLLRILMFIAYILLIRKMPDIMTTFRYHGAEHKCIHCFENNLELTPANCQQFYTLHPRCGTSFLMFVMVISLILFSLLGWPTLLLRIGSRLLLLPVIAGLSYEILKWAGRSDNPIVKVLSIPGLYLQKLTTAEPEDHHLEVAIAAVKAVLEADDVEDFSCVCDLSGRPKESDIVLYESEERKNDGTDL